MFAFIVCWDVRLSCLYNVNRIVLVWQSKKIALKKMREWLSYIEVKEIF